MRNLLKQAFRYLEFFTAQKMAKFVICNSDNAKFWQYDFTIEFSSHVGTISPDRFTQS